MIPKENNWSIVNRITGLVAVLFAVSAGVMVIGFNRTMKQYALEEARLQARIVLDRNLAVHAFYTKQLKPALFPILEQQIEKGYFEPAWMSSTYAVREINTYSKEFAEFDYYYKECAVNARSPANEADLVEKEFIQRLNSDASLIEQSGVRIIEGRPYFTILRRGETMESSCLRCHSSEQEAPVGLLEHYPENRSFGRHDKEVVSAVSIRIPLDNPYSDANQLSIQLALFFVLVLSGLYCLQFWLLRRFIFTPLRQLKHKVEEIAGATEHLGEKIALPAGRELRELATDFNVMSINMKNSFNELQDKSSELLDVNRKLQKNEETLRKFKFLSDHSTDAHFLLGRDALFVYVNEAACRLLGYSKDELLNLGVPDVDTIYDLDKYHELFDLIQRDTVPLIETINKRKDGSTFSAELSVSGFSIDGKPYMFTALRDITERKRTQKMLDLKNRISRIFATFPGEEMYGEVLQLILEEMKSKFGVFSYIDEDGSSVTPSMTRDVWDRCQMTDKQIRFPRETWGDSLWVRSIIGKKSLCSNEPSLVPEGHLPIDRVLAVPIIHQGEVKGLFQVANKETDYDEQDRKFLEDIAGEIAVILSTRLQREFNARRLVESEAKYVDLYNNAPDMYVSVDAKSEQITQCNQTIRNILGRSEKDLIGRPINEIYHPDCRNQATEVFQEFLERGEIRDRELQLRRRDGSKLDVSVSVSAVRAEDGTILSSRSTLRDISDRKRVELELRKLNEELDQHVKNRTAELASKNEELERMNQLFVGRERKMIELKNKIKELESGEGAVRGTFQKGDGA